LGPKWGHGQVKRMAVLLGARAQWT